ncbi:MAG: diphosphomevalonate decarboxylase, partial [Anaerolineales bacterium]|nr:diphosphomevalonate decarboxylase [Anaerolineales bacterium]
TAHTTTAEAYQIIFLRKATAIACANIAMIIYWGNRDPHLRLPSNPSLSMNLAGLETCTTVSFDDELLEDEVYIGGVAQTGAARKRVVAHLNLIRSYAQLENRARVESHNNFPAGAGIASSASAFAALTLAAAAAAGLAFSEAQLSALARRGSGSACRSVPGGFVEWRMGTGDTDSYAISIAPPEHWALADVIAMLSAAHKPTASTEGHALAETSPLQAVRVAGANERLARCKAALLARDFTALADVVELDSTLMHAVMMTSTPPLYYWEPLTLTVMKSVRAWRTEGLPVCFTIDAGPNVHCLTLAECAEEVKRRLRALGVPETLTALPGGPARLIPAEG